MLLCLLWSCLITNHQALTGNFVSIIGLYRYMQSYLSNITGLVRVGIILGPQVPWWHCIAPLLCCFLPTHQTAQLSGLVQWVCWCHSACHACEPSWRSIALPGWLLYCWSPRLPSVCQQYQHHDCYMQGVWLWPPFQEGATAFYHGWLSWGWHLHLGIACCVYRPGWTFFHHLLETSMKATCLHHRIKLSYKF